MAGNWGRGWWNTEAIRRYPVGYDKAYIRFRVVESGNQKPKKQKENEKTDTHTRIRLNITIRRIRIDPKQKRKQYLTRLERLFKDLDLMLADPQEIEPTKLKAMDMMVRIVKMCYQIVQDIDVEILENELEELKEENQRRKEETGKLDFNSNTEDTRRSG